MKLMIDGCNLHFWTLAAPAYSAALSMLELTWCVQLLFCTKSTQSDVNHWYPWNFVEKLQDYDAVVRFTVVCSMLHLLWLISSLCLIFQIKTPKRWMTMFWLFSTFLVTLWSLATSIYFVVRLNDLQTIPKTRRAKLYNSYLALLLIFSGGFLFCTVNICLLVFLGRKWMDSCIFCPKSEDSRGFYNPLSSRMQSIRNYNSDNSDIQMDDVIFDATQFRVNKVFSINDERLTNGK